MCFERHQKRANNLSANAVASNFSASPVSKCGGDFSVLPCLYSKDICCRYCINVLLTFCGRTKYINFLESIGYLMPHDFFKNNTIPAHIVARRKKSLPLNSALSDGVSLGFAQMLSIKQKSWIAHDRGKQWVLSHQSNSKEPASKIEVIVVKANPYISKMYCQDSDDLAGW